MGIILLMVLTIYILSFIDYTTVQVEDKTEILKFVGYKMLEEGSLQLGKLPNKNTIDKVVEMSRDKMDYITYVDSIKGRLATNPSTWNEILSVFLKIFGNVFIGMSYVVGGIVYTVYKIPLAIILLVLILFISQYVPV